MTCPVCDTSVSTESSTCPNCQADLTTLTIVGDSDGSDRPKTRRPGWLVFGGVAVVVLAVGAAAMAFMGGDSPSAKAQYADRIPADAAVYFEVDVAALTSEDTKSIFDAFGPVVEAQTGEPFDIERLLEEAVASIDGELSDLDLSYRDDIASWATGPVAVGVFPRSGFEPGAAIVVGGDDADALDSFLAKVASAVEGAGSVEVGGVTFQALSHQDAERVLVGRQGTDLLVASDEQLAARLVDPSSGETMADRPGFSQAIADLPAGAVVVFAANPQAAEAIGGLGHSAALEGIGDDLIFGSVSTDGGNLRVDYVTELGDTAPTFAATLPAALPAETIAFFRVGPLLDQYTTLAESDAFEGVADEIERELGFSIDDLLAVFSVDGAVAVWPSTDLLLPVNAALVGVSDQNQAPFVDLVAGLVETMGIVSSEIDGGYAFEGIVNLGTRAELTFLTTDRSLLGEAPSSGLDTSALYRRAQELVDGEVVGLVDIPAVIGLVQTLVAAYDPEIAELLSCLPIGVIAAGSEADGNLVSTSVVVEIQVRC
ncbi:hypothetical protein BH23ACT5_BH23ACT5_05550 [soil metagenome]